MVKNLPFLASRSKEISDFKCVADARLHIARARPSDNVQNDCVKLSCGFMSQRKGITGQRAARFMINALYYMGPQFILWVLPSHVYISQMS